MRSRRRVAHEFVEYIPDRLEDGTLYVSIGFATVVHLCVCGCGNEVVTPLSPVDWRLTFDGETITLYPSIGNWSFPCRSHYWIEQSEVVWAPAWTQEEIEAGRTHARSAKAHYLGEAAPTANLPPSTPEGAPTTWPLRLWSKISNWLR